MTNPTPDYSLKVHFDSVPRSIEKLDLATPLTSGGECTLFSPEMTTTDIKKRTSLDDIKPTQQKTASNKTKGIIKKSSSSSSNSNSNNKRRLTFNVNEKNEINEDVYTYWFPGDADHNDCWWMDDELDQLLTDAMLVADHYTRKRKDWQNKIKSIMKTVSASSSSSKSKVTDSSPSKAPKSVKASDLDFVVDSDARGLELYIHPIFQKNREKAIKGVVKVQEEYNAAEKKKGKVDHELRLKVLRAQSLKLTNLARLMAKTMADGDRRAAAKTEEVTATTIGNNNNNKVEKTTTTTPKTKKAEIPTLPAGECLKDEDLVKSEELNIKSAHYEEGVAVSSFDEDDGFTKDRPAPRPRARSPKRSTILPRARMPPPQDSGLSLDDSVQSLMDDSEDQVLPEEATDPRSEKLNRRRATGVLSRSQLQSYGLKELQQQDHERMNKQPERAGSGGISSLRAALEEEEEKKKKKSLAEGTTTAGGEEVEGGQGEGGQ